jgi:hypothetical protein
MRPFLAVCAQEVSGKPIKEAVESMQKPAPQNLRNSLFVNRGFKMVSLGIFFKLLWNGWSSQYLFKISLQKFYSLVTFEIMESSIWGSHDVISSKTLFS